MINLKPALDGCPNCGAARGDNRCCPRCREAAEREVTHCRCGAPAALFRFVGAAGHAGPVSDRNRYELVCRECYEP